MCKDNSCSSDTFACTVATIPYVVGPSCTGVRSCSGAQIGSVDSSCRGPSSCANAQLSDVDLINSCNKEHACQSANGTEAITELIDCCNEEDRQCFGWWLT